MTVMKQDTDSLDYAAHLAMQSKTEKYPKGCEKCKMFDECKAKFTPFNCAMEEAVSKFGAVKKED